MFECFCGSQRTMKMKDKMAVRDKKKCVPKDCIFVEDNNNIDLVFIRFVL